MWKKRQKFWSYQLEKRPWIQILSNKLCWQGWMFLNMSKKLIIKPFRIDKHLLAPIWQTTRYIYQIISVSTYFFALNISRVYFKLIKICVIWNQAIFTMKSILNFFICSSGQTFIKTKKHYRGKKQLLFTFILFLMWVFEFMRL